MKPKEERFKLTEIYIAKADKTGWDRCFYGTIKRRTDSDGIPNQYKSAPSAAELRNAVTAKIFLLMRSINPLADHDDRKTYALGEKTVAAQRDRYIRRVFSSTTLLRNRIERIY